jgi:glutaredoxin
MSIATYDNQLVALFTETETAHQKKFKGGVNDDPEWPIWYADYLQKPMSEILQTPFLKSDLIYCLMSANYEHAIEALETQWQQFYSSHFIKHFAPTDTPIEDTLALYHMPSCPYCRNVRQTIEQLGIDVELRNINESEDYRDELVNQRHRATVPVLRIISPSGDERWMPESRDIVSYLIKTYE